MVTAAATKSTRRFEWQGVVHTVATLFFVPSHGDYIRRWYSPPHNKTLVRMSIIPHPALPPAVGKGPFLLSTATFNASQKGQKRKRQSREWVSMDDNIGVLVCTVENRRRTKRQSSIIINVTVTSNYSQLKSNVCDSVLCIFMSIWVSISTFAYQQLPI